MLKLNPYGHPPFLAPIATTKKQEVGAMKIDSLKFVDASSAFDFALNMLRDRGRLRT